MRIRKPAEIRKSEIVEAALRLADKLGPDRLTTEVIAQAVGLTQPGVFRHFPSKQDLWEAVVARIGTKMEARWTKTRRLDATPTDRVRALVATQLRLIQTTPAITAILFSRELHVKNDALRKALYGVMGRFQQLVRNYISQARDAGEFRADLDCNDAAFLVIGLVQGLAVRWSLSGRAFNLAGEGSRLLDLQLNGFACWPPAVGVERRPV